MDTRHKRGLALLLLIAFWLAAAPLHAQTAEPTPAPPAVEPGSVTVSFPAIVGTVITLVVAGVTGVGFLLKRYLTGRIDRTQAAFDAQLKTASEALKNEFTLDLERLKLSSQQTAIGGQNIGQLAEALSKLANVMDRQMHDVGTKLAASTLSSEKAATQSAMITEKFDALQKYLIETAGLPAEEAARAAKDISVMFEQIADKIRRLPDEIVAKIPPALSAEQFSALLTTALAEARQKLAQYQLVSDEAETTKAAVISTAISTAAATAAKAVQPPTPDTKAGEP